MKYLYTDFREYSTNIRLVSASDPLISDPYLISNFDGYGYHFSTPDNIRIRKLGADMDVVNRISDPYPIRWHPYLLWSNNIVSLHALDNTFILTLGVSYSLLNLKIIYIVNINFQKSSVNNSIHTKAGIHAASIFYCQLGSLQFTYLGLHI